MDLSTYQQHALRTAVPTALSRDYLVPMIVGEVGELFGKVAKAARDGWHLQQLEDELISEYGDIAWGTAVLLHLENARTRNIALFPGVDPFTKLLRQAEALYSVSVYAPDVLGQEALYLWQLLGECSLTVTREPFEKVLQGNVDKLAGRAQRGTVQGSGDNR